MISMIPWCNTGNEGSILGKDYLSSFDAPWSEWSWINLLCKQILNPFLNLRIQSWAAPKKRKLSQNQSMNKELKIVRYFVLSLFEAKPVKGSLWKKLQLRSSGENYVLPVIQYYFLLSTLPVWHWPPYLQKGTKIFIKI